MPLKSKALIPVLAAVTVIMTSHGAYASSDTDYDFRTNASGSTINMDASRTAVQESVSSVDLGLSASC